jgi:hypothetical protein
MLIKRIRSIQGCDNRFVKEYYEQDGIFEVLEEFEDTYGKQYKIKSKYKDGGFWNTLQKYYEPYPNIKINLPDGLFEL